MIGVGSWHDLFWAYWFDLYVCVAYGVIFFRLFIFLLLLFHFLSFRRSTHTMSQNVNNRNKNKTATSLLLKNRLLILTEALEFPSLSLIWARTRPCGEGAVNVARPRLI